MLKLVVVAVVVWCVMYVLAEIGDRHGFSPLSKVAQAFDTRMTAPPPLTAPTDTLTNAPAAGAEGMVA